jgi:subtilisin family serine protease
MRRVRTRAIAVIVTAAMLLGFAAPAGARTDAHVSVHPPATGVIVRWETGSGRQVRTELARRGLSVRRGMYRDRGAVVTIPEGSDAAALTETLSQLPGVRVAAEDRAVMRPLWTPNDPLYGTQWSYSRTQAESAWDIERGQSFVEVAVIDTGVDLDHPDLVANLDFEHGYDFVSRDTTPNDLNGHGTHVTGIVAASSNNATGVAGTAPGVRVVPIKVIGAYTGTTADFIEGLEYAADLGVDVANMSLGSTAADIGAEGIVLMQEAVDYARSKGVVLIAATGNSATSSSYDPATGIYYPAACVGVIGVGATGRYDALAGYSNYGPQVDIVAPGGDDTFSIRSTYPNDRYAYLSGTSMACPQVAGAVALLLSHVPAATAAEVEAALLSTTEDRGVPGWDQYYGYGLLQMRAALDALEAPSPQVFRLEGPDRYATTLAVSRSVFDTGTATTTVIASGENFPDALAASSLAGACGGPLLLTRTSSLPDGLLDELARISTTRVVIVGGEAAVGASVSEALMTAGFAVERVAGADRYETAAAVAEKLMGVLGVTKLPTAFLARGDLFPDALAAAPFAHAQGIPVLLTRPSALPTQTLAALASVEATEIVVLGSSSAVGTGVVGTLTTLPGAVSVSRWQGVDRYATAAQIARDGTGRGWATGSYFGVATGVDFPDALAGSVACGSNHGALLLTHPTVLSSYARDVLQEFGSDGVSLAILGSSSAVSKEVEGELMRIRY